ncbi:MAG: hypothetical protein MJA83_06220, partial [Gammaproteobacteria bacterium]|nr:hypothetical protein [Gammaproteobacteria bacterium]
NSNRLQFDDVDDFDGWSPTNIQDRDGTVRAKYSGWSRGAVVDWANRLSGDVWTTSDSGLKRIVVTVVSPEGTATSRFGFRQKHGSLQQAPSVDTTVVTQLRSSLKLGSGADSAQWTTNLLNHVEDPSAN